MTYKPSWNYEPITWGIGDDSLTWQTKAEHSLDALAYEMGTEKYQAWFDRRFPNPDSFSWRQMWNAAEDELGDMGIA